jgi:hypothetical protein
VPDCHRNSVDSRHFRRQALHHCKISGSSGLLGQSGPLRPLCCPRIPVPCSHYHTCLDCLRSCQALHSRQCKHPFPNPFF